MYMYTNQSSGLQSLYNAVNLMGQRKREKEAEAERKRQLEEQRRQQREANKHSAFGDTLKLVGTIGGAAVGSFTPVGPVGGAAIGSTLADATMAFAPNVGGTQPGADNPYYTPTTDTQKALTAVNAGLQFYSAYEADKIAKERALAAAEASNLRSNHMESNGFQSTRNYVTGGLDAPVDFAGSDARLQATGIETPIGSLARDLKDSGKYSFLKDEDFLLIAAGEAEKLNAYGPTLESMTLNGSFMLLEQLEKPGATTQSVLAELDAGETQWAKEFKQLPRVAQTTAKSDFMKQSRATLAAANELKREQAGELAKSIQGRVDAARKDALSVYNDLATAVAKGDATGQTLRGFTEEQVSSGQIMTDPTLYRRLLSSNGVNDPSIQYVAMQQNFGADSRFAEVFSPEDWKLITPTAKVIGLEITTPEQAAEAANVTKDAEETNNQRVETPVEAAPVETTQRQVEPPAEPAEPADGVGVGLRQLLNLPDDESEEETTPYDQTRSDFEARQQEKFAKAEDDPERLRAVGRPVNLSPEEARANFEAEKEARKTRSRRPGLAAEYQRDLALGEAANEDPPPPLPPESDLNRMYEDQSVQKEQQASIAAAQTPVSPNVTNLISESMDNAKLALGRKPDPAPAADLTELRAPEVPRPPLAQEDIAYAEPDPEPRNPEDNERVDPALRESRVEALNVVKELNNAFTDLRQKVENSMGQDFDSLNELSPVELRYELNAKQREIDNLTARFDELESGPLVTKEASGEELTEALREYDNIRQSGGRILTELRLMQGERLVDPVIENKVKKLTERYPELSDAKGGVRRRSAARTYYETEMRLAGGLNGMLSEINNRLADTDAFAKAGRIEQAQLEYAKAMHLIEEGLDKYRGANYGQN